MLIKNDFWVYVLKRNFIGLKSNIFMLIGNFTTKNIYITD